MLRVCSLFCLFPERASSAALRQAAHLAGSLGQPLRVLRLREDDERILNRLHTEVGRLRGDAAAGIQEQSVSASAGSLQRAIRRHASGEEVPALVLVAPPRSCKSEPPLRCSVLRGLLDTLPWPLYVLVPDRTPDEIDHVLVPTDFSASSVDAFQRALGLASLYGASVSLLHVVGARPYVALSRADRLSLPGPSLPEKQARRRLRQVADVGNGAGVPVRTHVAFGEPPEEIDRFADRENIDLVALAVGGQEDDRQPLFGSVAGPVLRRVARSFFLFPSGGRSAGDAPL